VAEKEGGGGGRGGYGIGARELRRLRGMEKEGLAWSRNPDAMHRAAKRKAVAALHSRLVVSRTAWCAACCHVPLAASPPRPASRSRLQGHAGKGKDSNLDVSGAVAIIGCSSAILRRRW